MNKELNEKFITTGYCILTTSTSLSVQGIYSETHFEMFSFNFFIVASSLKSYTFSHFLTFNRVLASFFSSLTNVFIKWQYIVLSLRLRLSSLLRWWCIINCSIFIVFIQYLCYIIIVPEKLIKTQLVALYS